MKARVWRRRCGECAVCQREVLGSRDHVQPERNRAALSFRDRSLYHSSQKGAAKSLRMHAHPHLLQRGAARGAVWRRVPHDAVLAQHVRRRVVDSPRNGPLAAPQVLRNLRGGAQAQRGALGLARLAHEVLHLRGGGKDQLRTDWDGAPTSRRETTARLQLTGRRSRCKCTRCGGVATWAPWWAPRGHQVAWRGARLVEGDDEVLQPVLREAARLLPSDLRRELALGDQVREDHGQLLRISVAGHRTPPDEHE